jgi:microcystin-dependent protein
MPATTTKGIPYPVTTDNNDFPTSMLNLVNWYEDILSSKTTAQVAAISGAAKFSGRVVFDSDKGQLLVCDGTNWHCATNPVGAIEHLAATATPDGYLPADGSDVSRTTYAKLFAKISTSHGAGDGSTTFTLPNLKGRAVVGFDASQTEFNVLGETGGVKTVTLTTNEMSSHSHSMTAHTHAVDHDHSSWQVSAGDHQHSILWNGSIAFANSSIGTFVEGSAFGGPSVTDPAGAHSHTVDIPNFTGSSANGGTVNTDPAGLGAAWSIMAPYIVLQPYIKF